MCKVRRDIEEKERTAECDRAKEVCGVVEVRGELLLLVSSCLFAGIEHRVLVIVIISLCSLGSLESLFLCKFRLERTPLLWWC